jgi:type 1 fimbria pilin
VSFRPGRIIAALAAAVFMITLFAGSASATASGTFSGAITPTSCGPMQDVPVVQGDTSIDAVAAEYVSANDITLDLYGPDGRVLVHGDTLTSPESVHYASDNLPPGTYHLQVCPFQGGVVTMPYDYTGA